MSQQENYNHEPDIESMKNISVFQEEDKHAEDSKHAEDNEEHSHPHSNQQSNSNQEEGGVVEKEGGVVVKDEEYFKKLQDEREIDDIKRNSADMWFTKLLVQRTWWVIIISVVLAFLCATLTIAFGAFSMSEAHDRNFLVWDAKQVIEWDMLELAKEKVQTNYPNGVQPLRTTVMRTWITSVTFDCGGCDNILTAEFVKQMYNIEQEIVNNPNYINFCRAVSSSDSSCAANARSSFANNFAGSINTLTQAQVDTYLASIASTQATYDSNYLFFEEQFTRTNLVSKRARAIYLFAAPIEFEKTRYKTYKDEEFDQRIDFLEFSDEVEDKVTSYDTSLKVLFYNDVWNDSEVAKQTTKDFRLAVGSFIFVGIYIAFHIKSIFLSCAAMSSIAISFPVTLLFTRLILRVSYFSSLNLSAIFVILGISADNVFVMVDTWRQTEQHKLLNPDSQNKNNNLQIRMNYAWRSAAKAILTTDLTTAIAFLATGLSKIMPVAAFGYFASFLVLVNFWFAVVTFPALVIVFERHLAHRCRYQRWIGNKCTQLFRKCCKNKAKDESKGESKEESKDESKVMPTVHREDGKECSNRSDAVPPAEKLDEQPITDEVIIKPKPKIEAFFHDKWNHWMFKGRYFIIFFTAVWLGIALWRVLLFESAKTDFRPLPDSHWLTVLQDSLTQDFHTGANDNTIQVSFLYGVTGVDQEDVGLWDASDLGKIIWDDSFDMSSTAAQQRILDICNDLKTSSLVKDLQVTWWVEDFLNAQNAGSPVAQANFYTELNTYLATAAGQNQYNDNQIGLIDGRLFFMRISAIAIAEPATGYDALYPVYEDWEALKFKYNSNSPAGINNAIQTALNHWSFLITQKELVDGAISGSAISLSFAFGVLLCSTLNIVIATYSIICIGFIMISAIATMQIIGWTLGVIESIAIVVLIGFSVDYVVHFSNHYVESVYEDRYRRVQESLGHIGISIISGAITTLGSSSVVLFATVLFFEKFGILVTFTILFSLFYSLLLFSAINHIIGPQKKFGNLKYYIVTPALKKIRELFKRCRNKEEKSDNEMHPE